MKRFIILATLFFCAELYAQPFDNLTTQIANGDYGALKAVVISHHGQIIYEEYFRGYNEDPERILSTTFEETEGYDEMIILRGIRFESHCEHHIAPIIGRAWVAYIPDGRVVGISKQNT